MTAVLVTLLCFGTFILMIVAMFEDLDQAEIDDLWDDECAGCGRHPGESRV